MVTSLRTKHQRILMKEWELSYKKNDLISAAATRHFVFLENGHATTATRLANNFIFFENGHARWMISFQQLGCSFYILSNITLVAMLNDKHILIFLQFGWLLQSIYQLWTTWLTVKQMNLLLSVAICGF